MDFAAVLATMSAELEQHGARYAVVGGVALAALGMPRTTLDLDLATDSAAQPRLVGLLERLGYETVHRSPGYSNHLHREPERGRVDVVYVDGDTAQRLFSAVRRLPGFGGLMMPVAAPEHLAAMKVLAMKNDPARTFQELADIRFLLNLPDVDRDAVREYFARHGLLERFHDVERTL